MGQYDGELVGGAALERILTELKEREATIQDVDNLPSTGGAEIGYEIVSIVVTVDSGAPQGTTKSGLLINAYYNGATVPSDVATTDSDGFAQLLVPMGYQYKLVFPTQQGCKQIADVAHTASVAQRSVEVEYQEYVETTEAVTVTVLEHASLGTKTAASGVTVAVTTDGVTTSYTTDVNGKVEFDIPLGTSYTVEVTMPAGYYVRSRKNTFTKTAAAAAWNINVDLWPYQSGVFIVDFTGAEYTLDEWQPLITAGSKQNNDAKLIKIATETLCEAGGVFYLDIDMVRGRTQGVNQQWMTTNISLPNLGMNKYQYDGLTATEKILAEAESLSFTVPAASACWARTYELAGNTLQGFLGGLGQWSELWANVSEVDDILTYTRPNGSYLMSTWTTAKWTSTQLNANFAYCWGSAALNFSKSNSCVVLPFFAY